MKWSYLWALIILTTVGLWLGSSQLGLREKLGFEPKSVESGVPAEMPKKSEKPFRVVVKTFTSEPRAAMISVRGRTEASRRVDARARTIGIVEKSPHREGERVKRGDLLCQVDIAGRKARLAEARAALASAQRDFEASIKLKKSNYASTAKLATDKAKAEAAQAAVDHIERDITYTSITAPISGIIETKPAEAGTFLQIGHTCATIVDLDPVVVSGMVSERDISKVTVGMPATANLITGEKLEGNVHFISTRANIETRTFEVEIQAPNPGKTVRDGVTAELNIPLKAGSGHRLPASALTLHDNGRVGVSTVTTDNTVKFMPVTILSFGRDHVWVAGLPNDISVILIGQEFVLDGQTIDPVHEATAKTAEKTSESVQ
jgi:multidrug efflux system membrane fusion protein